MSAKQPKPLPMQLAKASWVAPLLIPFMALMLRNAHRGETSPSTDIILTVVGGVFYIVGTVCGVTALFGIPRFGKKGILAPALIGTLLSATLLTILVSTFWSAFSEAKNPQTKLLALASSLGEGLPKDIDEDTRLLGVTARSGELVFDYSLTRLSSADVDAETFEEAMKSVLVEQSCDAFRWLWKNGFSTRSQYSTTDGVVLANIVISGADCVH